MRRLAQQALIKIVRPYIAAELPGWGLVYSIMIGSYERNAFWKNAPKVVGRNKLYGFKSDYDLELWADRSAFFLGRWYDLPSQLLICAVGGKTIVDVGANRGEFSMAAAAMNPDARIIAFEPNPDIASILKHDLLANGFKNVEVRECGLGDRDEVLPLYVPNVNSGSASFGGFQSEGTKTRGLPIRIGDGELRDIQPDLIKIDVEGFELRALKGLQKTIENAQPIVETELVEDNLARCGTSRREVEDFMTDLGYRGFGMALHQKRRHLSLKLTGLETACDAVWLPKGVNPNALQASMKSGSPIVDRAPASPTNSRTA